MGLESGSFINDLVATNPVGASDAKSQGDDHLRLIKELVKATLPNATRAVELRGLLGGQVSTELTIGTGVATPTQNLHTIDTQADDATDDLDTLVTTNIPDGGFLLIRPENDARTVVVKHNAGGAGQIALTDDLDFTMDQADKLLIIQRSGADWVEVTRGFGTDSAAAQTFLGVLAASTTVAGLAEIATQAEVDAGTDATRYVTPETLTLATAVPLPRGYKSGCVLSNNSIDDSHDIDISVGAWRDKADTENLKLASALGKQIDAAWAVGGVPGATVGGLDTGTVSSNDTYHVHIIKRTDTGVVDVLFSLSATSPSLPTNYDKSRRIGAVLTNGSANIKPFLQFENLFTLDEIERNFDANNPGTSSALRTMSVPTGIKVEVKMIFRLNDTSPGTTIYVVVNDPDQPVPTPSATEANYSQALGTVTTIGTSTELNVVTNTSGQVRTDMNISDAGITISGFTVGWRDTRDGEE